MVTQQHTVASRSHPSPLRRTGYVVRGKARPRRRADRHSICTLRLWSIQHALVLYWWLGYGDMAAFRQTAKHCSGVVVANVKWSIFLIALKRTTYCGLEGPVITTKER